MGASAVVVALLGLVVSDPLQRLFGGELDSVTAEATVVPSPAVYNLASLTTLSVESSVDELTDMPRDLVAIERLLERQGATAYVATYQKAPDGSYIITPVMAVNADHTINPASTIKLLTAAAAYSLLVPIAESEGASVLAYAGRTSMTIDSISAAMPGSGFGFRAGDQSSLLALFGAAAGLSANDATDALTAFISTSLQMNPYAADLADKWLQNNPTALNGVPPDRQQAVAYINAFSQVYAGTSTRSIVTIPSGLDVEDVAGVGWHGQNNAVMPEDMARIALHVSVNMPELADFFNHARYQFTIAGGAVPQDDQCMIMPGPADGSLNAECRSSVLLQHADGLVGRRTSEAVRATLTLAKTGFDREHGTRIVVSGRLGDGTAGYLIMLGNIGDESRRVQTLVGSIPRFPAASIVAATIAEALLDKYGIEPATATPSDATFGTGAVFMSGAMPCPTRARFEVGTLRPACTIAGRG